MGDDTGQRRVSSMEKNNRNTGAAKGLGTRTPRKQGNTGGFAKNPTNGSRIATRKP